MRVSQLGRLRLRLVGSLAGRKASCCDNEFRNPTLLVTPKVTQRGSVQIQSLQKFCAWSVCATTTEYGIDASQPLVQYRVQKKAAIFSICRSTSKLSKLVA
jgi:hypothetical protein